MNELTKDLVGVMIDTWPMITLTCVVLIVLRVAYLIKNKQKLMFWQDLMMLTFVIYILCLFQIVTGQDVSGEHGINITFFRELTRYELGSSLFYHNIVGNILLFVPFGFFTSYYLDLDKKRYIFLLTFIISIVIESIQLNIGRAFDVDDVILNLVGGFLGFLLYRIIDRLFGDLSDNVKGCMTLMFIMLGIIGVTVILF